MTDAELLAQGGGFYTDLKTFPDGKRALVARFAFTCAILYDLDAWGYADRWCYHTHADAVRALAEWDGTGEPTEWHRHPATGRRYDKDGKLYV
jgi:hypothetical protein